MKILMKNNQKYTESSNDYNKNKKKHIKEKYIKYTDSSSDDYKANNALINLNEVESASDSDEFNPNEEQSKMLKQLKKDYEKWS